MSRHQLNKPLSQAERMDIFLAVVQAQDDRMTVLQARKVVAGRFGVSEQQVRQIEQEGLDNNWPPLE
jgi:hypothetical protein